MKISCVLAPDRNLARHATLAESLGYHRIWLPDSPAIWGDVWIGLAEVAHATRRIGLGTAVVVPNLRHVMVTASAIASLHHISPGRLTLGVGAGLTGAELLGQRPMRWRDIDAWIRALRALLSGQEIAWQGSILRMCHAGTHDPGLPIEVPIFVAAEGPKGFAVAQELGDGLLSVVGDPPHDLGLPVTRAVMGTILDEGETVADERVRLAAGPPCMSLLHAAYAMAGPAAVDSLPGGAQWREAVESVPEDRRHLAVHEGHMTYLTQPDASALTPELISLVGITGTRAQVRERLGEMRDQGVAEVALFISAHQPERELTAFAEAAAALPPLAPVTSRATG